jgi:DNA-binding transcriptional LysR family regulator
VVLPWEQLRVVLAVARHGTLSGAARALGTVPDLLERALKGVERAAGAALFVREEGRLILTDAGRSAMHTGERMAEEMARVDRVLPRVPPGPPIRVRVEEALAAHWLQTAATDLTRKLGTVTLEILTGRAARRQEADLEVTSHRAGTQVEPPRALGITAAALYASEAYLLDHGRPSRPDQLLGHRVVLLTGTAGRGVAGRWLMQASRAGAQVALRTDSIPVFLSAVHAGVGLGVLPRGSEELAPELVCVSALPELPARPLWLVFRGAARPGPRVRRAAQVLEQTLGAALRRWER